jgi:hypothetical protein
MCLKFQLTSESTPAIVAKAMCRISARNLAPRILPTSYFATSPMASGVRWGSRLPVTTKQFLYAEPDVAGNLSEQSW